MNLSHNEVEAMVKKAARGAGYDWGMTEEAGKAARWLNTFDLNGCEAIAHLFKAIDGRGSPPAQFFDTNGVWKMEGSLLCPLHVGTALSDFAFRIESQPVKIGSIRKPVLLIPFGASAARQLARVLTMSWCNVMVVTDGGDITVTGEIDDLYLPIVDAVDIYAAGEIGAPFARKSRVMPSEAAWNTLCTYAQRTYAPATEESRIRGAGGA